MRTFWVVGHRCIGLSLAVFLFIAGSTGAAIAWDHEFDAWLYPELYLAEGSPGTGAARSLELARELEASDPRLRVQYLPLSVEPGRTLLVSVEPRIDPSTLEPFPLGFSQVALHPETGEVRARRLWGELSLRRESLMPFLYKLHYSLHLPWGFGRDLGMLLMGLVAVAWLLDTGVALWISFPSRRTWRRAFAFRWRNPGPRLTFDLHRSGGVWAAPLIIAMALTAVAMNLEDELVRPIVGALSPLREDPFADASRVQADGAVSTRGAIVASALSRAKRLGIAAPVGGVFYSAAHDVYGVGFFDPGQEHGDGGLGNPWLYYQGQTARPAGEQLPGVGSFGDLYLQAQLPVHSGRVLGVIGRAVVSGLGLWIAMLGVTGVLIWARRRRARLLRRRAPAVPSRSPRCSRASPRGCWTAASTQD